VRALVAGRPHGHGTTVLRLGHRATATRPPR
jgi:hypothetical protein